jgi:hypothetical protein
MTITDVEYYIWSYKMPSRQLVNVDSSLLRSNWHIKSSKLPISLLLESLTTQCHVSASWIISHFGSTRHVNSRDYGFRMVYVVYGSAETEGRHDVARGSKLHLTRDRCATGDLGTVLHMLVIFSVSVPCKPPISFLSQGFVMRV